MENLTSQMLFDELQRRLYAIPVEKLAEYMEVFEAEYINRMAANNGYVPIYEDVCGPVF
jgi:hypothetical protein